MIENTTNIKVPKKYEHMIDFINHDETGYWVTLSEGYYSPETGCYTIHETSQKAVLEQIRNAQVETYTLEDEDGTIIADNMSLAEAIERYRNTTRKQSMYSKQTGTDVEKLWENQHLIKADEILLDEVMEELHGIEEKMKFVHSKELEIEYNRLRDIASDLACKVRKWFDKLVDESIEGCIIGEVEAELEKERKLSMLTDIKESYYVEKYEYSRIFTDKNDCHSGFAFKCTKDGEVLGLEDEARAKNYKEATESGKYIDEGIEVRDMSYYEYATGVCQCGRRVRLAGNRNACACGLEYNAFGQALEIEEW